MGQLISAILSWPAVEGVLKGYDQLLNLVLDETVEYSRGSLLFQAKQCTTFATCEEASPYLHGPQAHAAFAVQTRTTCSGYQMKRGLWD